MVNCPHCIDGQEVYGSVCYGTGPNRVYKLITSECQTCLGTGKAPNWGTFHGWTPEALNDTLERL